MKTNEISPTSNAEYYPFAVNQDNLTNLQNALLIAEKLAEESFARGFYAIHYALELQITLIRAVLK